MCGGGPGRSQRALSTQLRPPSLGSHGCQRGPPRTGPHPPETVLRRQPRRARTVGHRGRRRAVRTGPGPCRAPPRRQPIPRTHPSPVASAPPSWLTTPVRRVSDSGGQIHSGGQDPPRRPLTGCSPLTHQPLESSVTTLPRPHLLTVMELLFIWSWRGCLCLVGPPTSQH